jgi:hypothetical protein
LFPLLIVLLMCLSTGPISAQLKTKKRTVKRPTVDWSIAAQQDGLDAKHSAVIVEKLLTESEYKYTSAGEGVWIIRRHGENLRYFQLVLYTGGGTLVTEVIVARAKSLRVDEAKPDVLRLAEKLENIKVGFDKDNDLFVRNEARLKTLTVDEFKSNLDKVAAAADRVYVAVKPFRNL